MLPTLFIDGQEGTTGLRIREMIAERDDVELLLISDEERKDPAARAAFLNRADVAILCLPDDAAAEAVGLIENPETRVIDTSTARRVAPEWIYGLPEVSRQQKEAIRVADRIANCGCYPVGYILAVRPLVEAGLIDPQTLLTVNAASGYSGGGRRMIEWIAGYIDARPETDTELGEQSQTGPYPSDFTEAIGGVNWKTDLSGGIQRVAIAHGCAPFGNAKARAVVWTFPDPVPLHREPLYTNRRDLVADYPTYADKSFWRVPTLYASIQKNDFSKDFPIILTSGRLVEYEGGGDETRSNPWLAELQQNMFIEINPRDANNLGVRDGSDVWVEGPEGGKIKVMALVPDTWEEDNFSKGLSACHTALIGTIAHTCCGALS